jgi:hypothetical protein
MTRTIHLGPLAVTDFGDDSDQFHIKIETRKGNIVIAESPQPGVDELTVELAEEGSQKQLTFSPEDFAMFSDGDSSDGGVDAAAVAQAVREQAPSTEDQSTTPAPSGEGERAEASPSSTTVAPDDERAGGAGVEAETPTLDNEPTTDDGGDASPQDNASAPTTATDGGEKPDEAADDADGSVEGADADTFM